MKKLDNSIKITLIIVGGILALTLLIMIFVNSSINARTITSSGTSKIEVIPDFIGVYFNVQTEGSTAKEASDENAEIVDMMKSSLLVLGFESDEIKTQNFNVNPNYDYSIGGKQRIIGYMASHSIKVEILMENKERVGSAIDAGIGAGAGISYINYELTDENQKKHKAEAIRLATEDARIKAEALAEGAGQKLGRLVSIGTSEFGYAPYRAFAGGDVAVSSAEIETQITPSEQDVTASVTAVFKIK